MLFRSDFLYPKLENAHRSHSFSCRILAPPGHGKSSLLKALSGALDPKLTSGSLRFGGYTATEAMNKGIYLSQLTNYVDQIDSHLPLLTVRETLQFVLDNATVDPSYLSHPELAAAHETRVQDTIDALHLTTCADTRVGDELLRGVSGGEKKRVTIAEALLSNARVLAMDEISTGLDAPITFDVCRNLCSWAKVTGGTFVVSLLQPPPETYDLFDNILLLREGQIVYHGPRESLPAYMDSLGFDVPEAIQIGAADARAGSSVDIADFIVSALSHPSRFLKPTVPIGTSMNVATLAAAWNESDLGKKMTSAAQDPDAVPKIELTTPFSQRQYGSAQPRDPFTHFGSIFNRQVKITLRNATFLGARIAASILMGLIIGSIFYQLSIDKIIERYAILLLAAINISFGNLAEAPVIISNKIIAYKQMSNGMYRGGPYVFAQTLVHIPIAFLETFILSIFTYFLAGLANDVGRFLFFWLMIFLTDIVMGAFFRTVSLGVADMEAAQLIPGPIIAVLILFCGFLITRDNMGWMEFLYYLSFFSWTIRSMAQNEFNSKDYDAIVPGLDGNPTRLGDLYLDAFGTSKEKGYKWGGVGYMLAIFFIFFFSAAWMINSVRIERNIGSKRDLSDRANASPEASPEASPRSSPGKGKKEGFSEHAAIPVPEDAVDEAKEKEAVNEFAKDVSARSALPFEPMTLAFKDIKYTVKVKRQADGGLKEGEVSKKKSSAMVDKVLLDRVFGVAVPGRMIALMGASGAGKTTLLDVLSGKKNTGKMEGVVTVNGHPKEPISFARITGYCEQQDQHNAFTTIKEALEFSAALRLPASVTAEQRAGLVRETLEILELCHVANARVGEPGAPDGISVAQRKLLTIGVELVANPSILFLDEPTSGLDARAASIVMKAVRNVASTGRTIICTIHQPSAELFFLFDDLLLLARGGHMAYFGPLGKEANLLVDYLSKREGVPPLIPGLNPATWMLDALAGIGVTASLTDKVEGGNNGEADAKSVDLSASTDISTPAPSPTSPAKGKQTGRQLMPVEFAEEFRNSKEAVVVQERVTEATSPAPGSKPPRFDSLFARNFIFRFLILLKRTLLSEYRNVALNNSRIVAILWICLLYGIVYYKLDVGSSSGVQSIVSCIFNVGCFLAYMHLQVILPVLIRQRPSMYRERASWMYSPLEYIITTWLAEMPWIAITTIPGLAIVYFMVGFRDTAKAFFMFFFVIWLLAQVFLGLGFLVAAVAPSYETGAQLVGQLFPLLFIFGGLFVPGPSLPIFWRWANFVDPIRYTLSALVAPQFWPPGERAIPVITSDGVTIRDRYEYVSEMYNIKNEELWHDIGVLAAYVGATIVVASVVTYFVSHVKR